MKIITISDFEWREKVEEFLFMWSNTKTLGVDVFRAKKNNNHE